MANNNENNVNGEIIETITINMLGNDPVKQWKNAMATYKFLAETHLYVLRKLVEDIPLPSYEDEEYDFESNDFASDDFISRLNALDKLVENVFSEVERLIQNFEE